MDPPSGETDGKRPRRRAGGTFVHIKKLVGGAPPCAVRQGKARPRDSCSRPCNVRSDGQCQGNLASMVGGEGPGMTVGAMGAGWFKDAHESPAGVRSLGRAHCVGRRPRARQRGIGGRQGRRASHGPRSPPSWASPGGTCGGAPLTGRPGTTCPRSGGYTSCAVYRWGNPAIRTWCHEKSFHCRSRRHRHVLRRRPASSSPVAAGPRRGPGPGWTVAVRPGTVPGPSSSTRSGKQARWLLPAHRSRCGPRWGSAGAQQTARPSHPKSARAVPTMRWIGPFAERRPAVSSARSWTSVRDRAHDQAPGTLRAAR